LTTLYRSAAEDTANNRAIRQGRGHSPLRQRGARQRRNAGGHENEQARNMRKGVSSKPSLSLPDSKIHFIRRKTT